MEDVSKEPILGERLLSAPENKKWIYEVINTTPDTIENISIEYSIITYFHDITFGQDRSDIFCYNPCVYKKIDRTTKIERLKPGQCMELYFFYMGTFPMLELRIRGITYSNQTSDINESNSAYYYYNQQFSELQDMQHLRQLLGLMR